MNERDFPEWLEKTTHWCEKEQKVLKLSVLCEMCPDCEKPKACTAWRKYHSIAFPKQVK